MQKIQAKKSLGQNFLKSIPALKKIVETGEISAEDIILEIGPGKGALTKQLLATGCQLLAVEKDKNLYELLKNKFQKEIISEQLKLLNTDILDFKLEPSGLAPSAYKVIANIPYNITGAILKKFLTEKNQPKLMVLMVQKEIAERIIARDGKESILSISVKAYGNPKMIMKVPARYFSPAPKVDSAVISIKNISRKNFTSPQPSPYKREGVNERVFWEIIHAGFAHKRKKLSSNLKKYIGKASVVSLGNKRAEELTLKDWIDITKML